MHRPLHVLHTPTPTHSHPVCLYMARYGGLAGASFERAAKGLAHDQRGASLFHIHGRPHGLCVPMQTMVDFCGFRLMAMPLLPVSHDSLVYGVDGRTGVPVSPGNPRVAEAMGQVGKALHLAPHFVKGVQVATAGECAGGVGWGGGISDRGTLSL